MTQNTAPTTCPAPGVSAAPSTTSPEDAAAILADIGHGKPAFLPPATPAEVLADLASGAPVAVGDASGRPIPADARCEYCRQVGNGCSLARCRNRPPVIPPATPTPTAPDNRRVVVAACACEGHYRGTLKLPVVRVPALRIPGVVDQDIIDAYAAVRCCYWSHDTMGELDDAALKVSVAYTPIMEQLDELLARRGIRVSIEHIELT